MNLMPHHHIVTVGISLLDNFEKARQLPRPDALRRGQQIAPFLAENPKTNCAEINSLDSRTGFLSKTKPDLSVSLIYSQTEEGKLCAKLIEQFLKTKGVMATRLQLEAIDLPSQAKADPEVAQRLAQRGLADLRTKLLEHVARLQRATPPPFIELNCTGGYKSECAVLYELGRALRLPVYYLHETFQVAVELP
ncbi:MAG: putative CRISPR-associated protein [Chloroflexi bacterium]|nr:putative CRISPR-associated protein [Chloroflexota bacterium]